MDAGDFRRLKQFFHELAQLSHVDRERWFASNAESNVTVRNALVSLLEIDGALARMTARPALARLRSTQPDLVGRRFGAFAIEQELGRGGMGRVFLARRADGNVEQKVALKLIRPEQFDANTRARFQLECQVLALLDHPNIARLLDVGESDGSPYVVMEYVEGLPITDYCDGCNAALPERLRLFIDVCDAVSHAHRCMVVHRDLKPPNILVNPDRQVKLLDFGIAKPLLGRLGSQDVGETDAAQRFFSPGNAAPEQLRGDPVTVACDIYALGVLLYELVTGTPPFDLRGRTPGEIEHLILEEIPQAPSARSGDRRLRGDIDAIVAKALRKQPPDRYATVDVLAGDVRRFLAGLPVLARKGRAIYRARKFGYRNRLVLSFAAAVVVVAIGAGSSILRARFDEQTQRTRANQMTALIVSALESVDIEQSGGKETTAREIFERVADRAARMTDIERGARADVLLSLATIDLNLGLPKQADALLHGVDDDLLDAQGLEKALAVRASTLIALGRYEEAYPLVAQGRQQAVSPAQKTNWTLIEATLFHEHGRIPESVALLESIEHASVDDAIRDRIWTQLGTAYDAVGRQTDAYRVFTDLVAAQRRGSPGDRPSRMLALRGLSRVCLHLGRIDEAKRLIDEAVSMAAHMYGEHSLGYVQALRMRQSLLTEGTDPAPSLAMEQDILRRLRQVLPEESPQVARALFNMAELSDQASDPKQAERYYDEAIRLGKRVWLPEHVDNMLFPVAYSCFLVRHGRAVEAGRVAEGVLESVETNPSLKNYDIYPIAVFVASLGAYEAGRLPETRAAAVAALTAARDGAESRSTRSAIAKLVRAAAKLGIEADGGNNLQNR